MKRFLSVCALVLLVAIGGYMYYDHKREVQREAEWQAKRSLQMAKIASEVRDSLYLVIDLSEGVNATSYPTSTLSSAPVDGWSDEYKTTKLILRRIEAGTFIMGGRWLFRKVTLTKPYYIGVFEVTQKQWALVMGNDPSQQKGATRPMEYIYYTDIRGSNLGVQWPTSAEVDPTSFMGKVRAKTSLDFDLPTEAQWEYACRAGTTTELNSGKDLTHMTPCPNMNEVGRHAYNHPKGSSGHATVGSYLPNNWGLYDMHGNVREWCLDRWEESLGTTPVEDPKGTSTGTETMRLVRGGFWRIGSTSLSSAARYGTWAMSAGDGTGFRAAVRLEVQ